MSGYGECGKDLPQVYALQRPGRSVIDPDAGAVDPPLEGVGILPDVMGQAGQAALFPRAEGRGELGA